MSAITEASPSQTLLSTPSYDDSECPEKLFDSYPGADIILRSSDSHEFQVPKLYITNASPILAELVRSVSITPDAATPGHREPETCPSVVQLPEDRVILSCLLTFIFPVPPNLPSTTDQTMELLSVAQKYGMNTVLTHIRDRVARQDPSFVRPENAFYVFSLAQRYKLRDEALQAARITVITSMTFDDLDGQLDIMPGALLYELWKYHQRVRGNLLLDLLGFRMTGARGTLKDLHCVKLSTFGIPTWLEDYIESIRNAPSCFDLTEFHISLTRHTAPTTILSSGCSSCASIPSETIHAFWAALTAVVHNSFGRAEADLLLVESETRSQSHTMPTGEILPPPENLNLRETDVILQSSDGANFRVHKVILATSSPFFSDMFSLARPSDDEIVDGLPVVCLSEDAEVLHSLITMLYPIPSVIPNSYDKVLDLLAASQKYDMVAVQSSIRAEVSQRTFPTLVGTGVFRAYAIASRKRLTPEMENAARLTLDHPMTFECIGEEISLFDGWALRDLARFRKRCRDRVVSCLETFLHCRDGSSKIWDGCCQPKESLLVVRSLRRNQDILAGWLHDFILRNVRELRTSFTRPLLEQSSFRKQFLTALQIHIEKSSCIFCPRQYITEGESYWGQLQDKLTLARDTVPFQDPLCD